MNCNAWHALNEEIVRCEQCPRLRQFCGEVAHMKKRAYRDWDYWGKPITGFGDPAARVLIVGLAPAAHGANRTGRVFTGDMSGNFLYRVLYKAGYASQPESISRDDGLRLTDAYVSAAVRCAPPANKPLPDEIRNCRPYLERELGLLQNLRVVVALGKLAFDNYLVILKQRGIIRSRAEFVFQHDGVYPTKPVLLASYHPSQQNTFTGKLTEKMMLNVFRRARKIAEGGLR